MPDFVILGKVTQVAPQEFFAVVSVVPACRNSSAATVRSSTMRSAEAASEFLRTSAVQLGALVRERGDVVVDVEVE